MKRLLYVFPLFVALTACSGKTASEAERRDQGGPPKIVSTDLGLGPGNGTAVISSAQKFILPVPAFGRAGEPLVYPVGHEKAGKPILDYQGKPIGEKGLVFFNAKDQSVQAVAGDGEGVVIVNEVTQEQAEQLYRKIQSLQHDPNKLTLPQLKEVLDYAREDLRLGDMYNSTRSFVKAKMTPAMPGEVPRAGGKEIEAYGLKKRDDRDVCYAVYVPGNFVFEGPAATPQVFANGGVIVKQGEDYRGVQPDIFVRTYRLQDGRQITSVTEELKVWSKRT